MAVYVDAPIHRLGRMKMCHMMADTHDELEAMARKLALLPSWIQFPHTAREHYDISQGKRGLALKLGALEVNNRQIHLLMQRKRGTITQGPWPAKVAQADA